MSEEPERPHIPPSAQIPPPPPPPAEVLPYVMPPPPPHRPPPPRRTPPVVWWFRGVVGVAAVVLVGFYAKAQLTGPYDGKTLRYEVRGDAPMASMIAFATPDSNTTLEHVPLPWSTEFTAGGRRVFSLQAAGTGRLSCRITVDGVEVAHDDAPGGPCYAQTPGRG